MSDTTFTYPSLTRSGVAYRLHSSCADLNLCGVSRALSYYIGEFATYDDGLCQHSPEATVHPDNPLTFADACASFATWAVAQIPSLTPEDVRRIVSAMPNVHPRADLVFALSVKYDEKHARYYNARERKVSSRESLRHDRRWSKVESWHDGRPENAALVLDGQRGTFLALERYSTLDQLREVYNEDDKHGYCKGPSEIMWPNADREDWERATEGYRMLASVARLLRAYAEAHRACEHYEDNRKWKAEHAARAAAEAAEETRKAEAAEYERKRAEAEAQGQAEIDARTATDTDLALVGRV